MGARKENDMEWVEGLPTKPGWYWFRNLKSLSEDEREPTIYYVRKYVDELAVGNCTLKGWPRMEKGQWAGPIPLPKESKE